MPPIRQTGIEMHRIEMLNGNKEFCQELLSDVRVPDTDRIGEVDDGWTVGTPWLFHERPLLNSPHATMPTASQPHRGHASPAPASAPPPARRTAHPPRTPLADHHMLHTPPPPP